MRSEEWLLVALCGKETHPGLLCKDPAETQVLRINRLMPPASGSSRCLCSDSGSTVRVEGPSLSLS